MNQETLTRIANLTFENWCEANDEWREFWAARLDIIHGAIEQEKKDDY